MADYVLFRNPQLFRHYVLHSLRILRRSPQRRLAVLELGESNHRLHRSVRQKRNIVVRLIDLSTFGERSIRITNIAHYFAGIVGGRSQFILVCVRVVGFVWSVVPCDVQLLAALKRRPGVIRNHRYAAKRLKRRCLLEWIDRNSLTHTYDLQGFLVVMRFHFATENGRMLHRRVHHSVNLSIHAINGLPGHKSFEVVTHLPFAYIPPGTLWFELQLFSAGDWQFRRSGRELTVARSAVRRTMNNNVQISLALRRGNTPPPSRRSNQHESPRCSRLAHCVVEGADRVRSICILVAVSAVAKRLL